MTIGEWLQPRVREYLKVKGRNSRVMLAAAADISVPLLERIMKTGHSPGLENAMRIARELGPDQLGEFRENFVEPLLSVRHSARDPVSASAV